MEIGPHLWGRTAASEDALAAAFRWLARVGVGVHFGSRPIGWYQQHQVAAIEAIEEAARANGLSGSFEVRARDGVVEARDRTRWALWIPLGTVRDFYRAADARARR